jgi:hypothetical protein
LYLHLALEHPKGWLKFLQVGVAPDGEARDFPGRSVTFRKLRIQIQRDS